MNFRIALISAGILGATGVILGAFGAHALESQLTSEQLDSYHTGVDYHLIHSLYLVGIGILLKFYDSKLLKWAAWLTFFGIIFFSFSIYLLSCRELIGLGSLRFLWPVTPLGGLLLIVAWILLPLQFIISKDL